MKILGGILMMGLGGYTLLFIYAFASMLDPALGEAEWRAELLRKMFVDEGRLTIGAILMLLGGPALIVADLRRRWKERAEFEAFKHDRPASSGPSYY